MKIRYASMWKCIWFSLGRWLVQFQFAPEHFGLRQWENEKWDFWRIGNIIISRDKEDGVKWK